MAVEQLSSRTVTAISAAAATDMLSQLKEGAILEGRVMAINPDDTLKLATRLGQLDIAPSLSPPQAVMRDAPARRYRKTSLAPRFVLRSRHKPPIPTD